VCVCVFGSLCTAGDGSQTCRAMGGRASSLTDGQAESACTLSLFVFNVLYFIFVCCPTMLLSVCEFYFNELFFLALFLKFCFLRKLLSISVALPAPESHLSLTMVLYC